MGDAADDAIDRGMDEWLSGEYDDEGYSGSEFYSHSQSCRYCRKPDLHWNILAGKWRLFGADGAAHRCAPKAKEVFK